MNDLRLPIQTLYFIEQFQKGAISLNRLYRKRVEYVQRKQWDDYLNLGLALTYITSLEKYQEKTGETVA
ncbi:hypothetical protein [Pseudoalteromonas sp. SCQQ13]|uniref:hypothetical protein n=1 Tax=Pseudoalteromonas sp. SCQQ13 TaxID=2792066 RepID=UPI0018CF80E5|nr:hypothetical protein [Pseudoalteromonas sp. SCQQ13]MBH0093347.1 hypothetical protein [Pseudoalteromonas sp. SCQQ13]